MKLGDAPRLTFEAGVDRGRAWELDVYADNTRAQRSYEKAGFRHEGTLRHGHFADGRFMDVERMALLRDEWLALDRPKSWEMTATE